MSDERLLWSRVDELVDRVLSVDQLFRHGLHLLAARRWRALGRAVPDELVASERIARLAIEDAHAVLERVRAACDGQVVLVHGLEVAAFYPDRTLRGFGDVDLLVEKASKTRASLIDAGFEPLEPGETSALVWGEATVPVELFDSPRWLPELRAPPLQQLLSLAQPSSTGIDGVGALPAQYHALVVATNSWAHKPLRRARDLVDIAALTAGIDDRLLDRAAREWGLDRLWRTTSHAADALLTPSARPPLGLRLLAADVRALREERWPERIARRYAASFFALPPSRALRASLTRVARDVRGCPRERLNAKLSRIRRGLTSV